MILVYIQIYTKYILGTKKYKTPPFFFNIVSK